MFEYQGFDLSLEPRPFIVIGVIVPMTRMLALKGETGNRTKKRLGETQNLEVESPECILPSPESLLQLAVVCPMR